MKILQIFMFCLIFVFSQKQHAFCQDPIFSQFYSNPLYLNPALAGTDDCSRVMMSYRNQWPSFENNFKTYSFSADRYFNALSGGLGILITSDNIGENLLNTTRICGIYSVHIRLAKEIDMNAGFEAAFHQQKLSYEDLIFRDMIDETTGNITSSTEIPVDNTQVMTYDFSGGLVVGFRKEYFIGIAAHHFTQPSLDFYNSENNNFLYRKYTVHAGARFNMGGYSYNHPENNFVLSPNVLYQFQQWAQQLYFGLYLEKKPLIAGLWYRQSIKTTDGIDFLAGIHHKWLKFCYSYDVTLSKLKGTTGGAHEVSLTFLVDCNKKRNKAGAIKCPEF